MAAIKAGADAAQQASVAEFSRWLAVLRKHVESGLPFRRQARLASITALQHQAERAGLSAAQPGLERFLRNERDLARDRIRAEQPLRFESELWEARVVVFAMQVMLFELRDGRQGLVYRNGDGGWTSRLAKGPESAWVADWFVTDQGRALPLHVGRQP